MTNLNKFWKEKSRRSPEFNSLCAEEKKKGEEKEN